MEIVPDKHATDVTEDKVIAIADLDFKIYVQRTGKLRGPSGLEMFNEAGLERHGLRCALLKSCVRLLSLQMTLVIYLGVKY